MSWSWPAEVGSVSTARHTVDEWLRGHRLPDPPLSSIALLVSEAVTNAVTHAYVGRPTPGSVDVTVTAEPDEVLITIEDQGNGMRPRPDSPGLGYGLALMVAVSQRFEAQSAENHGTRLRAWFSRDPAAATLSD
jgi:anti-sigma regulatory factor (Ser/Thr protein kinase)